MAWVLHVNWWNILLKYFECLIYFLTFEDVCFFSLLTAQIIACSINWATEKVLLF